MNPASTPTEPSSQAPLPGVVVYRVSNGSLLGTWAHPSLKGQLATERATGGKRGQIPGTYDVVITSEDQGGNQNVLYRGLLEISAVGQTFKMEWYGKGVPSYSGTGFLVDENLLAACYVKVTDQKS